MEGWLDEEEDGPGEGLWKELGRVERPLGRGRVEVGVEAGRGLGLRKRGGTAMWWCWKYF